MNYGRNSAAECDRLSMTGEKQKTRSLWNCIGVGYLGNVGEITTRGSTANLCNINSIGKVLEVTF